MILFRTEKEYSDYFWQELSDSCNDAKELQEYINKQLVRIVELTDNISKTTFWKDLPEILGLDAKLNLLVELCKIKEFSSDEIIRITENDYRTYFKELCGYDLSMKTKNSMIFNIS
ncbi:DUF7006 family protein [Enterococcus casseliflavus]|uniref:DUF7006 family protein n=1 Tax=Enterococcus TaxID=1350 RepID=UPI00232ED24B|nr:hypothetical protein [Enterococcus casseliflavus]MDB1690102.1 hypothetical protein [Enterococcus casseliflavus]